MCYFVNDTNYVDLMVLSKNIKKYLTKYIMPLLAKSCVNQYTTDISLPQTININLKYSGTCISRNVNRYALKKMRQKRTDKIKGYFDVDNYIRNKFFEYDENYKAFNMNQFEFVHNAMYDKISCGNNTYHSGFVDWFLDDLDYVPCMFNNNVELLDFINQHGGNCTILDEANVENISGKCYIKMRNTFIKNYEEKHKNIQFYAYYGYDTFKSNIELRLLCLGNMLSVCRILDNEIKKKNYDNPDEYSLGHIRYVGHFIVYGIKIPVYSVGHDH